VGNQEGLGNSISRAHGSVVHNLSSGVCLSAGPHSSYRKEARTAFKQSRCEHLSGSQATLPSSGASKHALTEGDKKQRARANITLGKQPSQSFNRTNLVLYELDEIRDQGMDPRICCQASNRIVEQLGVCAAGDELHDLLKVQLHKGEHLFVRLSKMET
jgi:hypothetical protein